MVYYTLGHAKFLLRIFLFSNILNKAIIYPHFVNFTKRQKTNTFQRNVFAPCILKKALFFYLV